MAKRQSPSTERGALPASPASSSPPTKMLAGGLGRREPCVVCSQPVFLAQRLLVGHRLYHRTCFRCARCSAQLSLAGCYETETDGQFCCETCPDEDSDSPDDEDINSTGNESMDTQDKASIKEQHKKDKNSEERDKVYKRTLSDEEKSYTLKKFQDAMQAESSAFMDGFKDQTVKASTPSKALTGFLSSQVEEDSDENDVLPALPTSLPPSLVPQFMESHSDKPPELPNSEPPRKKPSLSDNSLPDFLNTPAPILILTERETTPPITTFENTVPNVSFHEDVVSCVSSEKLNPVKLTPDVKLKEKDSDLKSEFRPLISVTVEATKNLNNETVNLVSDISLSKTIRGQSPECVESSNPRENVNSSSLIEGENVLSNQPEKIVKEESVILHSVILQSEVKSSNEIMLENVNIDQEPYVNQLATASDGEENIDKDPSEALGNVEVSTELDCVIAKDNQKNVSDAFDKKISNDDTSHAATTQSLVKMRMKIFEAGNSREEKPDVRVSSVSSLKNIFEQDNLTLNKDKISIKEQVSLRSPDNSIIKNISEENDTPQARQALEVTECVDNMESQYIESEVVPCNESNESLPCISTKIPEIEDKIIIDLPVIGTIDEIKTENAILTDEVLLVEDKEMESAENLNEVQEIIKKHEDEPKSPEVNNVTLDVEVPVCNISTSSIVSNEVQYPEDLNPFSSGDDDDIEKDEKGAISVSPKTATKKISDTTPKKVSTNPFGSDSEDEEIKPNVTVRKKSGEKPPRPPPPAILVNAAKRGSYTLGAKRVIPAPANLNPFSSGEDDDSDDGEKSWKPVPSPRHRVGEGRLEPSPAPRMSLGAQPLSFHGSCSSLASTVSRRKKAPAPKPPSAMQVFESPPTPKSEAIPESSDDTQNISIMSTLSTSTSSMASPQISPRSRKRRPAPLPPSASSTLLEDSVSLDVSLTSSTTETIPSIHQMSTINSETASVASSEKERPSSSLSQAKRVISAEEFDNDPDMQPGGWNDDKLTKEEKDKNRQSTGSDGFPAPYPNKSSSGQWKRRKGPAPAIPLLARRRSGPPLPPAAVRRELQLLEAQQRGLERQGVRLEEIIRERCEGKQAEGKQPEDGAPPDPDPETDELVLQLFELVNEKNELFRRQAELMYIRRQQRLEEEHADLEHQIRCLMARPEVNKTDSDKAREEQLIQRLLEVVERRNEVVTSLEADRLREREEDKTIRERMASHRAKREENNSISSSDIPGNLKKEKKKEKKKWMKKDKPKKADVENVTDETEKIAAKKEKKHKKWFN